MSLNGSLINEDWLAINGGDGFVCRSDPFDPDLVYFEIQDGGMARRKILGEVQADVAKAAGDEIDAVPCEPDRA